jgi:hypothetical protein
VWRRHENEENGTVFGNLHGGMAERRAGSGGTSIGTKALLVPLDDASPAAAANFGTTALVARIASPRLKYSRAKPSDAMRATNAVAPKRECSII